MKSARGKEGREHAERGSRRPRQRDRRAAAAGIDTYSEQSEETRDGQRRETGRRGNDKSGAGTEPAEKRRHNCKENRKDERGTGGKGAPPKQD